MFFDLLEQVDGKVAQVSADGAYDTKACHRSIAERDAKATIPPRNEAVPWGGMTLLAMPFLTQLPRTDETDGRTTVAITDAALQRT